MRVMVMFLALTLLCSSFAVADFDKQPFDKEESKRVVQGLHEQGVISRIILNGEAKVVIVFVRRLFYASREDIKLSIAIYILTANEGTTAVLFKDESTSEKVGWVSRDGKVNFKNVKYNGITKKK